MNIAASNFITPLLPIAEPNLRPPPNTIISPEAEGGAIKRDPRQHTYAPTTKRGDVTSVAFRSLITAPVLESVGCAFKIGKHTRDYNNEGVSYPSRPSKIPDSQAQTLQFGSESSNYYYAARGRSSENIAAASVFRTAAMSYAQNYFSGSGTFARAGESLELTA